MAGTIKIGPPKATPTVKVEDLTTGDTVEVGLSSEFSVDGDHNWATVKISATVQPGETGVAAFVRVEQQVLTYIKQTVLDAVDLVQGLGS